MLLALGRFAMASASEVKVFERRWTVGTPTGGSSTWIATACKKQAERFQVPDKRTVAVQADMAEAGGQARGATRRFPPAPVHRRPWP
jgi:hypothetical protein